MVFFCSFTHTDAHRPEPHHRHRHQRLVHCVSDNGTGQSLSDPPVENTGFLWRCFERCTFFFPLSTNPCLPKRYGCQPCMQLPSASSDFSNTRNWVGSNAVGEKKWRRLAARLASCTNSSTGNVTFRMTTTTYTPCPLWRTCLSYIVEWASPSQERRERGLLASNPTLRGRDGHARGPGGRRPLRLRQGVGADELQRRPTQHASRAYCSHAATRSGTTAVLDKRSPRPVPSRSRPPSRACSGPRQGTANNVRRGAVLLEFPPSFRVSPKES